jgi:hypothetical protein
MNKVLMLLPEKRQPKLTSPTHGEYADGDLRATRLEGLDPAAQHRSRGPPLLRSRANFLHAKLNGTMDLASSFFSDVPSPFKNITIPVFFQCITRMR